eukprot:evm.model.scf_827.3 EVM.evm.TU.scf_827.3   scf_827:35288-37510(-)
MADQLVSSMQGLSLASARSSAFGCCRLAPPTAPAREGRTGCASVEAAHKKGAGSTKNGRDSNSKRRGVKIYGMQKVKAGGIIVRQLGTKFHAGENVGLGRDYTLFAKQEGIVMFEKARRKGTQQVSVYSADHPKVLAKLPAPSENGAPSRRERRRQQYRPRAELRAEYDAQIQRVIDASAQGSAAS